MKILPRPIGDWLGLEQGRAFVSLEQVFRLNFCSVNAQRLLGMRKILRPPLAALSVPIDVLLHS